MLLERVTVDKHLHIIHFDLAQPAVQVGPTHLFPLFAELKALGVQIHFHYLNGESTDSIPFAPYCASIHHYILPGFEKKTINPWSIRIPRREYKKMTDLLLLDQHPLLLQGLATTELLLDPQFRDRISLVQLDQVLHLHFQDLYHATPWSIRKLLYGMASIQMRGYEKKIAPTSILLGHSQRDLQVFQNKLGATQVVHVPQLPPYLEEAHGMEGMGNYCLFHANLGLESNEKLAIWLLEKVFRKLQIPFVIAGAAPSRKLDTMVHGSELSCLVANPSAAEMHDMISKAHVHLFPGIQHTGIPQQLYDALLHGRHCVVHETTLRQSGLEPMCHAASTASSFQEKVSKLYHQPFTLQERDMRKKVFQEGGDYSKMAGKIRDILWG